MRKSIAKPRKKVKPQRQTNRLGLTAAEKALGERMAEKSGWRPWFTVRPLATGGDSLVVNWKEREPDRGWKLTRRQFRDRAEMDTWVREQHTIRGRESGLTRQAEKRGDSIVTLAKMPPAVRAAVLVAVATIRDAGGDPRDIAQAAHLYVEMKLTGARKKIWRIVGEHLKAIRQRRRPATYQDRRRNLLPLLRDHGRRLAATFTTAQAEDWTMAANTETTRVARRRALHALFEFARKRGYIRENPVSTVEKIEPPIREAVQILSPADAAELMRRAEEHAPELVPYLAIGLFAGLRPMNELRRLSWDDVLWNIGKIRVSRASSKTNQPRFVPMADNLKAWLETVPKADREGQIFYSRRKLDWLLGREPRRDRRIKNPGKIIRKAELEGKRVPRLTFEPLPWGQDILRHSRTSYRLAQTHNVAMVAAEGGHTAYIMRLHYANQEITEEDAKAYWNIRPKAASRRGRK